MANYTEAFVYLGIPVSVIILALVQVAKGLGLPTKFAPLCAIVLGLIAGGIGYYIAKEPNYLFFGLISGLLSSGLFSNFNAGVKLFGKK